MNDYMYDYIKGVTDSVWEFASQEGKKVSKFEVECQFEYLFCQFRILKINDFFSG